MNSLPFLLLIIFLQCPISSDEDRFWYEPLPPASEFQESPQTEQRSDTSDRLKPKIKNKVNQDRSRPKSEKLSSKERKKPKSKSKSNRKNASLMSIVEKFSVSYRQCLLERLGNGGKAPWKQISSAVNSCFNKRLWTALKIRRVKEMQWKVGHKFIILPTPITSPCIAVMTDMEIEVKDVSAAQEFHHLLPQCVLYGIGETNEEEFRKIGIYFEKVIAFTDGGVPTTIQMTNGINISAELPPLLISTKTLLERYVKQSRIDYLWMDSYFPLPLDIDANNPIKLSPQTLLKLYYPQYSVLVDPIGTTVCQVAVTTALSDKSTEALNLGRVYFRNLKLLFKDLIIQITSTSPFLPIRSKFSTKTGKLRQLYVNMADPYCAKTFLAPALLKDFGD